jgi:hypothetical protein
MTQHRSVPPVTEELRARARSAPGTWLYAVDPAYDPAGRVPPEAIVGAWPVDARGEIGRTFQHNPRYRPSARALELPEPTDPLDAAVQAAATGHAGDGDVAAALLAARLLVPEDDTGAPASVASGTGPALCAYSAPAHADRSAWRRWRTVSGRELAAVLPPGHDVAVNPESAASVRVPAAALRAAAG